MQRRRPGPQLTEPILSQTGRHNKVNALGENDEVEFFWPLGKEE